MAERKYVPTAPGMPVRELVYHEIYDTKEIFPDNRVVHTDFFRNPNAGGLYLSNMTASGQLHRPQEFYLFGIGLEFFNETGTFLYPPYGNIEAAKKKKQNFEELKMTFLEKAEMSFRIGAKSYLEVPLSRFFAGQEMPSSVSVLSTTDFPRIIPKPLESEESEGSEEGGVTEEQSQAKDAASGSGVDVSKKLLYDQDAPLFVGIGNPIKEGFHHHVMIERFKKKPLHVIVTDQEPMMGYIDLTVIQRGKRQPLHIPAQQSFLVSVNWHYGNMVYREEDLGKLWMRFFLRGYLIREIA